MKHWKPEILIAAIITIVIPLSYWLLSPFFAQLIFVPVLVFGVSTILSHKYGIPFLFLTITGLTYFIFLSLLSSSFDWSLWLPSLGIVWGFGTVGSLVGLFTRNRARLPIWPLLIYTVACLTITLILMFFYTAVEGPEQWLCFYLLIPLTCFLTQVCMGFFYPSRKWHFLVTPIFFLVIHTFMHGPQFSLLVPVYLILAAVGTWMGQKAKRQKIAKS